LRNQQRDDARRQADAQWTSDNAEQFGTASPINEVAPNDPPRGRA